MLTCRHIAGQPGRDANPLVRRRQSSCPLVIIPFLSGRKVIVKPSKPKTMTEAEVFAAAKADPDNRLLTAKALAGMKPVARVKTLRRALSLTQQEFAQR